MSPPEQPRVLVRLAVPADPGYLALCRHALAGAGTALGLGDESVEDLKLVLSEMCMNAIQHGYGGGEGVIELEFRTSPHEFEARVRDHGRGIGPPPWPAGAGLELLRSLTLRHSIEPAAGGGTLITFAAAR